MENEFGICPECLQPTLGVSAQSREKLRCTACNFQIAVDVYVMSMQLVQKNILLQALKLLFQKKDFTQKGLCVSYHGYKYIVGFDRNGNLVIDEWNSSDWKQGLVTDLILNYDEQEIGVKK